MNTTKHTTLRLTPLLGLLLLITTAVLLKACGLEPEVEVVSAGDAPAEQNSLAVEGEATPEQFPMRSGWLDSNTLVRVVNNNDGSQTKTTFNFEEQRVVEVVDQGNDGNIDLRVVKHIDGTGDERRVVREEYFKGDRTEPHRIDYFNARQIRWRQTIYNEGVLRKDTRYTYNNRYLLTSELVLRNTNANPGIDMRLLYYKDPDSGRTTSLKIDLNNDGAWNHLISFNQQSLVETKTTRPIGRSFVQRQTLYEYIPGTDEVVREFRLRDTNDDGRHDLLVQYDYTDGDLHTKRVDHGADGTVDQLLTYSEDGLLMTKRLDQNGNGVFERLVSYLYDSEDRLIAKTKYTDREDSDSGSETVLEATGAGAISTEIYDSMGNRVRTINDRENDGVADSITHYLYDHEGGVITERLSFRYNREAPPALPSVDFASQVDGDLAVFFYDGAGRLVRVEPKNEDALIKLPAQVFFYGYVGASARVVAPPVEDAALATDRDEQPLPLEAQAIEALPDYSGLSYREFMGLLFTQLDTNALEDSIVHQSDFGGSRFYRNADNDIVKATSEPLDYEIFEGLLIYYYHNAAHGKEVDVWVNSAFVDGQMAVYSEEEDGITVSVHVNDFDKDGLPDEVVRYYFYQGADGEYIFKYKVDNNVDGIIDEVHE